MEKIDNAEFEQARDELLVRSVSLNPAGRPRDHKYDWMLTADVVKLKRGIDFPLDKNIKAARNTYYQAARNRGLVASICMTDDDTLLVKVTKEI
jgi:hypothetical protein